MDILKLVEIALVVIGAASVAALGIQGALELIAPKTESTVDDKALGFVGKLTAGLKWLKAVLDGVALNLKK